MTEPTALTSSDTSSQRQPQDDGLTTQIQRDADLQKMLFYSLLGGLCPLIPIPFLDDLFIKQIRRRMFKAQLVSAGLKPGDQHLDTLTWTARQGCFKGCLLFLVVQGPLYILKKIFRKIFFFLAVKDCVDVTSRLLHEGWLLQYMLTAGHLTRDSLMNTPHLEARRDAMLATCHGTDTRPLNQLLKRFFKSSKSMVYQTVGALGSMFKKAGVSRRSPDALEQALDKLDGEGSSPIETLLQSFSNALSDPASQTYLERLEQDLETNLEATTEAQ